MLLLLDCGLGQQQLYAMPVRRGGLDDEQKESTSSATSLASSTTAATATEVHNHHTLKRKHVPAEGTDLRQDWASFLRASALKSQPSKKPRGTNNADIGAIGTLGYVNLTGNAKQDLSAPIAGQEYMFKLPDFSGVDLKSIDVVLISNYNHILALPYLTEYTDFQGRIFATEPTIEFGRQLMTEFVSFFGTSIASSPHAVIDRQKLVAQSGSGLYPAYTLADVKACIDKIQPVRFREHIALYGSLKLTAHSAGYCLGSSNWLIQIGTENIAYISSSSSQVNFHPDLLDGTLLEHASTVIATDLAPKGSTTYDNGVNEVCANIALTISRKGNVLIPCTISGSLFDLLEDVQIHMNKMGLHHQGRYCFVSPVSDAALQYSNILAEWMAPRKQEMVYLPEAPLLHDPRTDVPESLKPFEGLELSQIKCPLDIRLSIDQLVEIMKKYRHPKHVLVPSRAAAVTKADGTVELADSKGTVSTSSIRWSAYTEGISVQLGLGSLYETVLLSEELAKGIYPQSFGNTSFAAVAGSLSLYNNQMQLEVPSAAGRRILALHTQRQLRGVLNLQNLLAGLAQIGIVDPTVRELGDEDRDEEPEIKVEFELEGLPACIIVKERETIIKCEENARPLLMEPILNCFQSL
ncbi:Integrator complex subunit 9 [Haplosporangium sp. Z 11]|nr:Integrator complex subunit 9 [Haplosporangium sp. Z 11]